LFTGLIAGLLVVVPPAGALPRIEGPPGTPVRATVSASEPGTYRHPVTGPVVDGFRPPSRRWLAGNRGFEYATRPGEAVTASAGGEVIFAGQVAGSLHVTVLHADGLRTSYSFVASIEVFEGQVVTAGAVLARADRRVHFGVRDPQGVYLDPGALVGRQPALAARLTPHVDRSVDAAARAARRREERSFLERLLETASPVVEWVGEVALTHTELREEAFLWMVRAPIEVATATVLFADDLRLAIMGPADCTPSGVDAELPSGERVAIVVPGVDSASYGGAIADLDTGALGLSPADVVRFSYAGGRAPAAGLDGPVVWDDPLLVTTHDGSATHRPAADSARLLAMLVADVHRLRPEATIEVYAHSLGGLVAVDALSHLDAIGSVPDARLVTMGTPHRGAMLARAAHLAGARPVMDVIGDRVGSPVLGEPVIEDLAAGGRVQVLAPVSVPVPFPVSVPVLSVAASGDFMVPAVRSIVAYGRSVIIDLPDVRAHSRVVGDPATTREMQLFLGGQPAGCRPRVERVANVVLPTLFDAEQLLVTTLVAAGRLL